MHLNQPRDPEVTEGDDINLISLGSQVNNEQ